MPGSDVSPLDYLETLSVSFASNKPQLAQKVAELRDLYDKKHWHEFCINLVSLLEQESALRACAIDIHECLLVRVRSFISPEIYVKMLHLICVGSDEAKISDKVALDMVDSAIAALSSVSRHSAFNAAAAPANEAAINAAKCLRALLLLNHGPSLEASRIISEIGDQIEATRVTERNPVLQAFHHRAAARKFELVCDYDSFYPTAFSFAEYGRIAGVPVIQNEMRAVAYKTAIAALLSKHIHNFGRLLTYEPFANALKEGGDEISWSLQLVEICNSGDVRRFEEFVKAKSALIQSIPDVMEAVRTTLPRKVRIMAILDLVFHTPADRRTFKLRQVADRCLASSSIEVESLLLSAMALKLIVGKIDGVDDTVEITWAQPRVLQKQEILACADAIAAWRRELRSTLRDVKIGAEKISSNIAVASGVKLSAVAVGN
jgi:26S proteasome regulatory subunit N9